jgi:hypothetical protein
MGALQNRKFLMRIQLQRSSSLVAGANRGTRRGNWCAGRSRSASGAILSFVPSREVQRLQVQGGVFVFEFIGFLTRVLPHRGSQLDDGTVCETLRVRRRAGGKTAESDAQKQALFEGTRPIL